MTTTGRFSSMMDVLIPVFLFAMKTHRKYLYTASWKCPEKGLPPSCGEFCPCVLQPDGKCWSYQSKYLAADIDGAVVSFPDLSMLDPPDPVDGTYPNYCETEECIECQRVIKQRLCQVRIGDSFFFLQ
ncbi:hypothetical protein Tcan_07974 [Toxocara canis]|uniref:Uncharacterized protein n=1 Tax=Toxocara canis TaxID=6265 RepID=A0A0B2W6C4_TOXCA|nr:hypothetical protein Tcan_07974 [Toxocara canis]